MLNAQGHKRNQGNGEGLQGVYTRKSKGREAWFAPLYVLGDALSGARSHLFRSPQRPWSFGSESSGLLHLLFSHLNVAMPVSWKQGDGVTSDILEGGQTVPLVAGGISR